MTGRSAPLTAAGLAHTLHPMNFSSFPPEQEQSFVVYEQHMVDGLAKAKTAAIVAGIAVIVVSAGIFFAIPPKKDVPATEATPAEATNAAPAAK